jgi:hypothetical protein
VRDEKGETTEIVDTFEHDVFEVFESAGSLGALRIFVTEPQGFHGLYLMAPYKSFDVETYQLNLFAHFFASGGHTIVDDKCLASLEGDCITESWQ